MSMMSMDKGREYMGELEVSLVVLLLSEVTLFGDAKHVKL